MYLLETSGLSHRFGCQEVLHDVSMRVPAGSIYGFLGPNGAGKTTTLRLVLGLLRKQRGEISVLGKRLESDRIAVLRDVGSLIENPSLYDHLTAEENLTVLQLVRRCSRERIRAVLAMVGLGDTGGKRARHFSLGMRQRLGIAAALLHQPSLIVLDEPTNGLDPSGILEVRKLLIDLNRNRGCTILVSSHLLAEVDKVATHVGILGKGQLLFQGTIDELRLQQECVLFVRISTSDNVAAARIATRLGYVPERSPSGEILLPPMANDQIAALNRQLNAEDLDVHEITSVRNDLETIFLNLVGK